MDHQTLRGEQVIVYLPPQKTDNLSDSGQCAGPRPHYVAHSVMCKLSQGVCRIALSQKSDNLHITCIIVCNDNRELPPVPHIHLVKDGLTPADYIPFAL